MTTNSLEIVTHCFCPPGVDQYAEHLKWQIASIEHARPSYPVLLSVCYTSQDEATSEMLRRMLPHNSPPKHFSMRTIDLEPRFLFRRAIGRNWCAKQGGGNTDVIWYTDVDYLMGPECFEDIARLVSRDSGLVIPATINISPDHETGHQMVEAARGEAWPEIDPAKFQPRKQKIAIGGCQIIGGAIGRQIGYLDGSKWVEPVDPEQGFRSCRCDKAWRQQNKLESQRLPIRGVYRIRHTVDGRDYTQTGEAKGTEVW